MEREKRKKNTKIPAKVNQYNLKAREHRTQNDDKREIQREYICFWVKLTNCCLKLSNIMFIALFCYSFLLPFVNGFLDFQQKSNNERGEKKKKSSISAIR